jgi:hypothetical protein
VDDTGTEYFDLHYPTLKAIGCWGIYDKIHIDDLNKFVKITAGEEKKRTEQYWNDRLKTLKVNEWDAFEKELLEVSRTLIVNLAFFDIVSGDRVAVWVNGDNLNYTIPREIRWGAPYSIPISEVSKKFVIRDCGCELYRQKHNLSQLFK